MILHSRVCGSQPKLARDPSKKLAREYLGSQLWMGPGYSCDSRIGCQRKRRLERGTKAS